MHPLFEVTGLQRIHTWSNCNIIRFKKSTSALCKKKRVTNMFSSKGSGGRKGNFRLCGFLEEPLYCRLWSASHFLYWLVFRQPATHPPNEGRGGCGCSVDQSGQNIADVVPCHSLLKGHLNVKIVKGHKSL